MKTRRRTKPRERKSARSATWVSGQSMGLYDPNAAKKVAKVRITSFVDSDVLGFLKESSAARGEGYQTFLNRILRERMEVDAHRKLYPSQTGALGQNAVDGLIREFSSRLLEVARTASVSVDFGPIANSQQNSTLEAQGQSPNRMLEPVREATTGQLIDFRRRQKNAT